MFYPIIYNSSCVSRFIKRKRMLSNGRSKYCSYLEDSSTPDKICTLSREAEKKINAERFTLNKARDALENNPRIKSIISTALLTMSEQNRTACLADLAEYQTRKELMNQMTIGYWLLTIFLGLIPMVLHDMSHDATGMYLVWSWLLLSNVIIVVGHRFYDNGRAGSIIKKHSNGIVVANPINAVV